MGARAGNENRPPPFFMRIVFNPVQGAPGRDALASGFEAVAQRFGMDLLRVEDVAPGLEQVGRDAGHDPRDVGAGEGEDVGSSAGPA
jgi:hypothetical protein